MFLSDFLALFKASLKFSRTFQESPLNSSTFQACANPGTNKCMLLPVTPICQWCDDKTTGVS